MKNDARRMADAGFFWRFQICENPGALARRLVAKTSQSGSWQERWCG
jgi:hypothetical protein